MMRSGLLGIHLCTSSAQLTPLLLSCCLQSAGVLEAVASLALRLRLKECRGVRTEVSCDAFSLMAGRINSVRIVGEGWRSPLNLTAQLLEVRPSLSCHNQHSVAHSTTLQQSQGGCLQSYVLGSMQCTRSNTAGLLCQ